MRKVLTLAATVTALFGLEAAAQAKAVEYMSQHPLPRKVGHGFCYIGVPHFHDFAPPDPRLYRQVDGQFYFVGDPSPFEYEGPRYAYYGAHPVVEADVQFGHPVYCYLRGPHYHWYQPAAQATFELKGGAYWYVGTYPPAFYDERPRYVAVNEAYAPIVYSRPVVDVAVAPPAFHGEIVAGGPGWRAGVAVGTPAVGVYVAPPPPPPVVQVGVGINFGGPPVVVEERRIVEVRDHHDNGKHAGWNKHGQPGWRGAPPPPPPQRAGGWRGTPPPQAPPPPHGGGWRGGPPPGHPGPMAPPAPHPGGGGQKHGHGWKR